MNIVVYFWAALLVLTLVSAGLFFASLWVGARFAQKGAGIGVGAAVLVILGVVCGTAKAQESHIGEIIVYEAAWLASALNFALVGGYIAGKSGSAARKRAVPAVCAAISLLSLVMLGKGLNPLVQAMRQLGIGDTRAAPTGPDTSISCKDSLKHIYDGFKHYAEVNDALPPAAKWTEEEDLHGAVQADEWFHCPVVSNRKDDKYGYAFNDAIAGQKLHGKTLAAMPNAAKTPLVFDSSNLVKNAHDGLGSLPKPGRHAGHDNILYCDGHIETAAP